MSKASDRAADLAQSWVENADQWTAAVRSGSVESRRLVTDQTIVEAVLAQRPRRVLDLGCGEGWLIRALGERGIEGVGVDGSPALIDAARTAGNGTFHVCSYAELTDDPTIAGCGFDVIAANFAILHEDVSGLLHALRHRLAEHGKLVIQTVHPSSVGGPYQDGWREEDFRSFEGDWHPMPWYFRTLGSWVNVLRESGYILTELVEPTHPDTGAPLSLLLIAEVKPA